MVFYDFEVFAQDWLVVILDVTNRKEFVFVNDTEGLEKFHSEYVNEIWAGFNSRHYDQWILKAILCGFDPKKVNDFIIVRGNPGWKFSSLFRNISLNNYDVMTNIDRGLKTFEGFMGNDIKETSVPFDIQRKLTKTEIEETIKYCHHDVEQTIEIFLQRKDDFEAHRGLVKLACGDRPVDLSLISKTKPQLSAIILGASPQEYNDEFDIDFPSVMRIEKYTAVVDWYRAAENRCYERNGKKNQLDIMIAGVPHQFGYGGLHGALTQYSGEGYFLNMDVASLYPSLMIKYDLISRSIKDPTKFEGIYNQRLQYKAEKNPLQLPLKLVLNSTYGVMKDKNNALFDPRQANRVCVYGQILLLDLMERLEPHCQIIQSNTDGVLVKLNRHEDYDLIDDICYEWEQRTRLQLEFDEYRRVYQKDVNNYILVDANGKFKTKGAYVKKLSTLDYDLPIVNRALVDYMVHGTPIEQTIGGCDDLKEFQLVTKISNKYTHIIHGEHPIKEKCIRIFASREPQDKYRGVKKISARTGRPAKLPNSPESCFIYNDSVNGAKCPEKLDKAWYMAMAKKRLANFGVI
jgi:DNA polymerase